MQFGSDSIIEDSNLTIIHNQWAYGELEMQKLSTQNDGGWGVKNENSIRNWHKSGWRYFL